MYWILFKPVSHVVVYLIFRITPRGRYYYYSHFTVKETESQRDLPNVTQFVNVDVEISA